MPLVIRKTAWIILDGLYYAVCNEKPDDLKKLQSQKFTVREMEILVGRSKSSVARDLKEGVRDE